MCARPILAIKFVIFIATTRYAYSPEDTQDVPCISHQGEQAQWRSIWIHLAARSSPRSWRMLANVRQWNAHQCSSSSNRSSKSTNKHDRICTDRDANSTIVCFDFHGDRTDVMCHVNSASQSRKCTWKNITKLQNTKCTKLKQPIWETRNGLLGTLSFTCSNKTWLSSSVSNQVRLLVPLSLDGEMMLRLNATSQQAVF